MSLKPPDDLTTSVPAWDASWDTGDPQNYGVVSTEGQLVNFSRGTTSSPDTEPHPLVKVERLAAHTEDDVSAGSAHQEMAAIMGICVGTAACEKQPIGVLGQAKTSANTDPADTSDALGVAGQARMLSGAVGSGLGGYFEGRKDSGVDAGCSIAGISVQSQNHTGTDDSYVSNGTGGLSNGAVLIANGADRSSCGLVLYRSTASEQFDVGIGFTSANSGAVLTTGIRMDDNAVTAIDINGTRTTGIDVGGTATNGIVVSGTFTASGITLSGTYADAINLSGATSSGAALRMGNGNISTGTSTGTKIATSAAQKLGFFGATPVVQQANVTDASVAHALNSTFSDVEVETALDALGTKINAILTTLETLGFHAAA